MVVLVVIQTTIIEYPSLTLEQNADVQGGLSDGAALLDLPAHLAVEVRVRLRAEPLRRLGHQVAALEHEVEARLPELLDHRQLLALGPGSGRPHPMKHFGLKIGFRVQISF